MPAVPADPMVVHPMPEQPRVVLLRPLVTSPPIEVGEFGGLYAPHLRTRGRRRIGGRRPADQ
jgi:hypothetical protein